MNIRWIAAFVAIQQQRLQQPAPPTDKKRLMTADGEQFLTADGDEVWLNEPGEAYVSAFTGPEIDDGVEKLLRYAEVANGI